MTTLTYAELEGYWIQAGGSSTMAPLMAAVALAESSGNPDATNPTDNNGRQTSWGLWQLSDGTHAEPNGWSDPLTNAKMAVTKYHSQGLGAWGTYTSGAYKKYLQGGVAATTAGISPVDGTSSTGTAQQTGVVSDLTDGLANDFMSGFIGLLKPFIQWTIWIIELAIGFALVGAGLFFIVQKSGAVRSIESMAVKTV
jgi:hypothetical protein